MRIVSLLPAASEIVAALGAMGRLVGVSHECDFPPQVRSLPRVTRSRIDQAQPSGAIDRAVTEARRTGAPTVEVDVELVAHLRPDVLIGQSVCEVCSIGQADLARVVTTLIPIPWVVTLHAHTLDGVLEDIVNVGEVLELRDEAEELLAGLRYRLRRVGARGQGSATTVGAQHAAPLRKPRVLVLEWLDPPYVAGHWVPELVELAGGTDVGGAPGEPSRRRTWADLATLEPDVVVVALCGFDSARARAELDAVRADVPRTLLGRRLEFLDGNAYTSRPGPRLVDAAERLAALITR